MKLANQRRRSIARGLVVLLGLTPGLTLPRSGYGQEELEVRRTKVDQLSATEKKELLAKKDRFDKLPPEEKQRIRELHQQLSRHNQSERLHQVLQNYATWLSTLSQTDRSELLDVADAEQRLAKIRELKLREENRWLKEVGLNAKDADGVLDWFNTMLDRHQAELQQRFPPDNGPPEPFADPGRARFHLFGRTMSREGMKGFLDVIPPDAITQLLDQLSEDAVARYAALDAEKKDELLANWIRRAAWSRFKPPPISDKQLDRMISELPAEERQKLERLPRERVYEELRKRFELTRSFSRPRHGNGGRRGGRRFDGERRPDERLGPDGREEPRHEDPRRDDNNRRNREPDRREPDGSDPGAGSEHRRDKLD
jgi:hypothetical protein